MFVTKIAQKLFLVFLLIMLIGCANETEDTGAEDDASDETVNTESADEKTEADEHQGGELRVAYAAQPAELDPHTNTIFGTSDIMAHVFETLVTHDSEYEVQPMLAESFEQSDDGEMITFALREDVLFHNGEEMTAEDVVASMNRWVELPGSRGNFEGAIFEAEDEYTVALHLAEPLSTALSSLAHGGSGLPAIMPKEIVDNAGEDDIGEYIGTGPFEFVEWAQDQQVHLTKFEDYQSRSEPADGLSGEKEALVDDIYFQFVTDSSTRVAGIQSGEYDVSHSTPYDNVDQLESDPSIDVHTYPNGLLNLFFNKTDSSMFADPTARQAITSAVNIEDIVLASYGDEEFYDLNHNMMMYHQEQWASDVGADQYNENDPETASQLLDEIGYDGEEITLLASRDYEAMYDSAVVIQSQLEELGMNVNLEVYDWATFLDVREDEDAWDLKTMLNTATPDPTSALFLSEGAESGWTASPELDELVDEFRSQPSLDEAMDLYDDLQEWYWDYLPIYKMADYNSVAAISADVDNFRYQDGFMFWNMSNSGE